MNEATLDASVNPHPMQVAENVSLVIWFINDNRDSVLVTSTNSLTIFAIELVKETRCKMFANAPIAIVIIPESYDTDFTAVWHVILNPAACGIDELSHPVLSETSQKFNANFNQLLIRILTQSSILPETSMTRTKRDPIGLTISKCVSIRLRSTGLFLTQII